jgi:hypothetical protein
MRVVEPKTEEPTREMLGHAMRGDLTGLEAAIETAGDETYGMSIALCLIAAGYIAVDVTGRWPTEADVREIARHTAATSTEYELREQDVYDFVSRGALGFKTMEEVFPDPEQDYSLPVLITAQLLVAFCPRDNDLWGYLDTIWNAVNAAEDADLSLLPALMLRSQRVRAAKKQ